MWLNTSSPIVIITNLTNLEYMLAPQKNHPTALSLHTTFPPLRSPASRLRDAGDRRLPKMGSAQTSHGGGALAQRDGLHEAVPQGDGVLKQGEDVRHRHRLAPGPGGPLSPSPIRYQQKTDSARPGRPRSGSAAGAALWTTRALGAAPRRSRPPGVGGWAPSHRMADG